MQMIVFGIMMSGHYEFCIFDAHKFHVFPSYLDHKVV